MNPLRIFRSLRYRLLAATVLALLVALVLAGLFLSHLFAQEAMRQFEHSLSIQLDQVTAKAEFAPTGPVSVDTDALSDPRWKLPYSGLYWQLDRLDKGAGGQAVQLRSRSLWDTALSLQDDALGDGVIHKHFGAGPSQTRLLILERTIRPPDQPLARWRVAVGADTGLMSQSVARFNRVLALALVVLLLLLVLAALAQVMIGLSPLRALQGALENVRKGKAKRLEGEFPQEVQPLIEQFNTVLQANTEVLEKTRVQAGNLAHALKTPLTIMSQAAQQRTNAGEDVLATTVSEQVSLAQRHIDWQLSRARAAGMFKHSRASTPVLPCIDQVLRAMKKIHAEQGLQFPVMAPPDEVCFAGEEQDLQEIVGNLLDNACKWARTRVAVRVAIQSAQPEPRFSIVVTDDGAGIAEEQLANVTARGVRLDQSTPGSGLGLAIVQDLAQLYGGDLTLTNTSTGGLEAQVTLPLRQ